MPRASWRHVLKLWRASSGSTRLRSTRRRCVFRIFVQPCPWHLASSPGSVTCASNAMKRVLLCISSAAMRFHDASAHQCQGCLFVVCGLAAQNRRRSLPGFASRDVRMTTSGWREGSGG